MEKRAAAIKRDDYRRIKGEGRSLAGWALLACVMLAALALGACGGKDAGNTGGQTDSTNASGGAGKKLSIKALTASNTSTAGNVPPTNAIDGDPKTQWLSGGPSPQWIQLDLGEETTVSKLRLNVSQTPAGPTTHQVYGGPAPNPTELLGTLDGNTQDNQWLELTTPAKNVRYLRITTVKSPSWVAWREIEVYK